MWQLGNSSNKQELWANKNQEMTANKELWTSELLEVKASKGKEQKQEQKEEQCWSLREEISKDNSATSAGLIQRELKELPFSMI